MKSHSYQFSNFRDPVGLVLRMVRSGDRAALSTLFRSVLTYLLTPVDLASGLLEKRLMRSSHRSNLPIILIVGAPRSGTTLLYQTLAHYLPVSYFNNFSAMFPRSPISACYYSNRLLRPKNPSFNSYYGNTSRLADPNDGFHIWNRWLGKDRYAAPLQINHALKEEMRTFFNVCLSTFKKPLLNKNNKNTDCMPLLASILDNVYFIECRRNPVYVVQSLIMARKQIQGNKAIGWGLRSKDSSLKGDPLGYVDDVCDQVYSIETKMREDKRQIEKERFIEVSYEQFCEDPRTVVQNVAKRILGMDVVDLETLLQNLKSFRSTNEIRTEIKLFERIQVRLHQLYGEGQVA